ncbi:MAG: hypothetical protein KA233_00860 [Novosphingobium sp.]|nr:hypothetical protein [Novosphingobium sp.]MBP6554211.1 hypothetical protein [Novosphingobium sp.]
MSPWKYLAASAVLAGIAMPSAASAAPVFLKCEMPNGPGKTLQMSVQLNEQGSTASYAFANGDTFRTAAIFTPNEVTFGTFSIDRSNLVIRRRNDGRLAQLSGLPPVSQGQCQVDRKERAF